MFLLSSDDDDDNGMEFSLSSNDGWTCSEGAESAIPLPYTIIID